MVTKKVWIYVLSSIFLASTIYLDLNKIQVAFGRNADQRTSTSQPKTNFFPYNLVCSSVSEVNVGPSWNTITIGISTLEELRAFLVSLGYRESIRDDELLFLPSKSAKMAAAVWACISDSGVIAALKIDIDTGISAKYYLSDFIAQY
jgi:hypothetical protein